MSVSLINRIKYSKTLYSLYYYIGSFIITLLKLIIKPKDNLIVFSSFGGRKYDDSPRVIYEKMILDPRFESYELVWAFISPENKAIPKGRIIKTDTLNYYITLLQARCWITNSGMERGLNFKGANTFYLNTWHGTPIKYMGVDINNNQSFRGKAGMNNIDVMLAQGKYEADIFSRVFQLDPSKFKIVGLPRNDELSLKLEDQTISILKKKIIGTQDDRKVILYAPTFREYTKDANNNCILSMPIDFNYWREKLKDKYLILFRAHYEVVKTMNINDYKDFIFNVSSYENLNELIQISDILISDYSSIFFDYSITNKPMISYAYDYEEYNRKRGLYFDIRSELSSEKISNDQELISYISSMDISKKTAETIKFTKKYVDAYGSSTDQTLDILDNVLSKQ